MSGIYVASAFSKNRSGGNKAGVVPEAAHMNEQEKTELARKLGYSETAFISPSEAADFKLEYFTPAGEVPLCGHATIGTFTVLNHLHVLDQAEYRIETKAGILRVTVDEDGLIMMEQNAPQFYDILNPREVAGCFMGTSFDGAFPIQIVSTGLKDIMLPVHSPDGLEQLIPDFDAIAALSREKDCVGIHAFSLMERGEVTAICRNFAPLYGINEESATGTSNCALACYLHRYGQKQEYYIFEQGYHLGSVSRIHVRLICENDLVTEVFVGGYGYVAG